MVDCIIRKAVPEDLKDIQDLNHDLFLSEYVFDPTLNTNWPYEKVGESYFQNRINEKGGVCFIAEHEGKIVGYLAGAVFKPYSFRDLKKISEVENILIKEKLRNQGIGEALIKEFVKWSKNMGAARIKVQASAKNLEAIAFYQRLGFVSYTNDLELELIK